MRTAEQGDGSDMPFRRKVEHFYGLLIFGGQIKSMMGYINGKMIKPALEPLDRHRRNLREDGTVCTKSRSAKRHTSK